MIRLLILVNVIRWPVLCEITHNRNNETVLIDHILTGYNRQARPVRDLTQPVKVSIGLSLGKILDLSWIDELLQWNASDFGGIESVTLLPTQVWLPDFGISNSAEKIFYEDHFKYFRVSLYSNGRIHWHPGGIYRTTCGLKVTYFPFDRQVCMFQFDNWEYQKSEQTLQAGSDGVIPDDTYTENGEWEIENTSACNGKSTDKSGVDFGYLKFYMQLKRKAQYSVINVLIPIILLSLMDLLVFWLPPESGEKASLGITVLLSFSVFLLVVDERMPRTSDTVPILTIYLSAVMITTGLSLFVTVVILHLHHRTNNSPVPDWLRRALCMGKNHVTGQTPNQNRPALTTDGEMTYVINPDGASDEGTKIENEMVENGTNSDRDVEYMTVIADYDKDWKNVVRRLDHGCFFVFIFIFAILLIIMIYPYDSTVRLESGTCTYRVLCP